MEVEDISTEEFSDVSQDKEEVFSFDSAQNEQIQELKQKLQDLENDRLPELQKVIFYHSKFEIRLNWLRVKKLKRRTKNFLLKS